MSQPTRLFYALGILGVLLLGLALIVNAGGAQAANTAGPALSIPNLIPAAANSTVSIPVSFTANGSEISSLIFSIDYDQTWITGTLPFTYDFSLPAAFSGSCTFDASDTDSEIDCFVFDPVPPLAAMPDGVFLTIQLRTLNAPDDTVVAVNFSDSPEASFGNTAGQSVAGSASDGSLKFSGGLNSGKVYFPILIKYPTPTPTNTPTATLPPLSSPTATATATATPTATSPAPGCSNLILNGGFETDSAWSLPGTVYSARYTSERVHSGSRALLTGILAPGDNRYSYSSAYQVVSIPADADSATLKFWNYPLSTEATTQWQPPAFWYYVLEVAPNMNDMQYVAVIDMHSGDPDLVYWQVSNRGTWEMKSINLMPYAGHTIQIWFTSYNDGWGGVTAMYVDDVSLEVCR